ncbi:MAG: hypothetical protein MUE40_20905 [Anaerolineae bacterium]|nr:hypothetical protein [Anaerolineae bacterium]
MAETVSPPPPPPSGPLFRLGRARWLFAAAWLFLTAVLALQGQQWLAQSTTPPAAFTLEGRVSSREAAADRYTLTIDYDADPGTLLNTQTVTLTVTADRYAAQPEGSSITLYLDPADPLRVLTEPPAAARADRTARRGRRPPSPAAGRRPAVAAGDAAPAAGRPRRPVAGRALSLVTGLI